jgi:cobalamin synthase
VHCYREALARLPEDIRIYSSAEDDIRRALIHASTRTTHAAVRLLQSRSSEPKAAAPARKAGRRAAPARKVAIHVAAATARASTPFPFPVLLVLVSTLVALLAAVCLSVWAKTRGRRAAT